MIAADRPVQRPPQAKLLVIDPRGEITHAPRTRFVEFLRPVRERYAELADDPGETAAVLKRGAEKAQQVAGATLARAKEAIGLLPRA